MKKGICPFTHNSALRKKLQDAEEIININTNVVREKVVERSGPTIGNFLIRKPPGSMTTVEEPIVPPATQSQETISPLMHATE